MPTWNGATLFVCPECRRELVVDDGDLRCATGHRFPLVGDVPVLVPSGASFEAAKVAVRADGYFGRRVAESSVKARWRRRIPTPGRNRRGPAFADATTAAIGALAGPDGRAVGLILGAGERGAAQAAKHPEVSWLLTDVDLSYGADAAVDATRLPLCDASVDVIFASHVLEHVVDPVAAAKEIERVLRPGGLVVATIPFTFPWHGVPVDFFRVTPSGMRALFRGCDVAYLAAGMGNGSALAYGVTTTLRSRTRFRALRWAVYVAVATTAAALRGLDRYEGAALTSSAFAAEVQFIGRRSDRTLTDLEVLADVRERFR